MEKPFRVSGKAVWGSGVILAVVALVLLVAGCGKATEGQGPVFLVLQELVAASGAEPGQYSETLSSDVLTYVKATDPATGNESAVATRFQDNGRATLHVEMKDIGRPGSPNTPSTNNQVVIERYHVNYIRADGRNTPGVDVPYGFDGMMTGTIGADNGQFTFPLVRASAKLEPPLAALAGGGGAQHISCIAQITFYGHDIAGNAVSVTGSLTVDFADWGDPSR